MSLPLIKYGNITPTIITDSLHQYPSYRQLLLPLGGYIVNSSDYYSYRIIGKLTDFLQLQEFIFRNLTVECFTIGVWCSLHRLRQKSVTS